MVAECLSGLCVVNILILLWMSYTVYPDDLGYDKNEVPLDQVGGEGEVECGSANRVRGGKRGSKEYIKDMECEKKMSPYL